MTESNELKVWQEAPFTMWAWSQDFIKALAHRPKIFRVLLRFVFGKHAYREFIGMVDLLILAGIYFNYELEDQEYHKEKTRSDFLIGAKRY